MTQPIEALASTLCIDINPERILGAIVDREGTLSSVRAIPTPLQQGRDATIEAILEVGQQILAHENTTLVLSVGISIASPVHRSDGLVLYSDSLSILKDVPLVKIVSENLHLPVSMENDVNAMALAEAYRGAAHDCDNLFYLWVDSDINGAIVQDGRIWRGMHSNAGEIGYLVAGWMGTKSITLGQRASGKGIAGEYNMRSRKYHIPSLNDIIQFAKQGDHLAIRVIRDGARIFGSVLCPVVNLLDPSCVVVGGTLAQNGDLWWTNFEDAFRENTMEHLGQVQLLRARYGEDAPLQGMALLAQDVSKPVSNQ
jgi:glucokinase